ncbi:hypothetical protein PYW07_012546 [Mythimna separata]|uniref:ZAD domain-containing protein n=1 Tax=Mythimna separata TaxID=271217 RepID=A0AAD7Y867_MYTSE|nr:hypothetical protein PYW07_012546 [Mythimna separata]
MEKLLMCRICLVENVRMYALVEKNMQDLYESLTDIPFITEDSRPTLACVFCYARLKQCCQLQRQCLQAEELFAQIMNEANPSLIRGQTKLVNGFVTTQVVNISIEGDSQMEHVAIKEELPAFCEELEDIIEPKEEPHSDDVRLKNINNGYSEVEETPRQHSEPVSDVMEFKIDVEEELEALRKKREATDTIRASAAKKPKEDIRRIKVANRISEEHMKSEKSDTKDIQATRDITFGVPHRCDAASIFHQETADIPSISQLSYRGNQEPESSFQWTPQRHRHEVADFNASQSRIHLEPSQIATELDVFQYFMDSNFVSMIVDMTNKYHSNFVSKANLRTNSRLQKWDDVTVPEMYVFFSILMLMTRNRHLTIEEHWSTDILLHAPVFSKLMSRNRFCMILSMLHFSDQSEETEILNKIHNCVGHARERFSNVSTPFKNICIDDSVVPFKGRLMIKEYLPKKGSRFEVKLFVLRDVETGIIIDFVIYSGAITQVNDPCNLGVRGTAVAALVSPYLGSNRHLYLDNLYSSPPLFKYLYDNNIYACGTVKKTKRGMPFLNNILQQNEMKTLYCGPLMALKWKDNKYNFMLSTIHDNSLEPAIKNTSVTGIKPNAFVDYTKIMSSVASTDTELTITSINCIRKTVKWYKKLFFRILDMHMLNSFFCYKHVKNMPNLRFADFQMRVGQQMVEKYHSSSVLERPMSVSTSSNNLLRVVPWNAKDHMPIIMEKYQRCRQCAIDEKRRKSTRFYCKGCNVSLCAAPCFEKYHTV